MSLNGGANTLNGGDALKKGLDQVTTNSFVQHVTRFDSETRSELTNLIQYLVIAIIPIYFLNRTLNDLIPDFDQNKGNIELLGEVIIHSISILLGIYLIHRIICYIPTFSGENLAEINFLNIVLMILFIGMNSDNGKKVNHVYERIFGEKKENMENKKKKKDASVVKVTQPLNGGGGMRMAQATHEASRADYVGAHEGMAQPAVNQVVQQVHTDPNVQAGGMNTGANNFGGMGMGMGAEPMAANEGFGAFSSF